MALIQLNINCHQNQVGCNSGVEGHVVVGGPINPVHVPFGDTDHFNGFVAILSNS